MATVAHCVTPSDEDATSLCRSAAATTGDLWPKSGHTRVSYTYHWTELADEKRLVRARATTAENLRASMDRLAALAEGE